MMDVVGTCYRFFGDLLHLLLTPHNGISPQVKTSAPPAKVSHVESLDDFAAQALTVVFGMDSNGRIKKEKARYVVERLGLIAEGEEGEFSLVTEEEEELQAEEIAATEEEDGWKRAELLRRAFMVFDKDGDGFIEAGEVKRVLECLGLGEGWEMREFERMVEVVDLNFDGKVDFNEFELMMTPK